MVAALIKFVQGGNVGTAGVALLGVVGTPVVVSNADDTGVDRWVYTVIDAPPSSALTAGLKQDGATPTWTWTPDTTDCVEVRLDVFSAGNVLTATHSLCFGVLRTSGRIIPAFTAVASALNFLGATRGWAKIMEAWLNFLDGLSGGGGGGTPPIEFSVGTSTASSATSIPAGSVVSGLKVRVDTAYNTGATLAVGQAGSASLLLAASSIDLHNVPFVPFVYDVSPTTLAAWGGSPHPVLATVAGASSGACTVWVSYSTPAP
jgi:hypothetical protein